MNIPLIDCPACGNKVSSQAEMCPKCGQRINSKSNVKMKKCPACGNEVSSEAETCPKCGHKLSIPTIFWIGLILFGLSMKIIANYF